MLHHVVDGRYATLDEALAPGYWSVGTGFDLASAVQGSHGPLAWYYDLGAIEVDQLSRQGGAASGLELFRSLQPDPAWPVSRWPSTQSLDDVFRGVFGTSLDKFYSQFAEWQEGHHRHDSMIDDQRAIPGRLSGRIVDANGAAVSIASVRFTSVERDEFFVAHTNNDGHYSIALQADEPYDIDVLVRGEATGFCQVEAVAEISADGRQTARVFVRRRAGSQRRHRATGGVSIPYDFRYSPGSRWRSPGRHDGCRQRLHARIQSQQRVDAHRRKRRVRFDRRRRGRLRARSAELGSLLGCIWMNPTKRRRTATTTAFSRLTARLAGSLCGYRWDNVP